MRFEFATANRILFGPGTCAEVPKLAALLGRRAFVVSGLLERAAPLLEKLARHGLEAIPFAVTKEPDVSTVLSATRNLLESDCDLVIGIGGGSALDTAKAVAALALNPGDPLDYLEVVGRGRPLEHPPLPCIAIPTTAGTGAEVTRNAVIAVPEHRIKVSLRSPLMLPRLAVVDPELTYSLPPDITAYTGLDALTQCLEPFVSNAPNPLTDAICREGLRRAGRSLRRAYENGADREARYDMSLAALCGGLALANARLGAVHGLAGPLGGRYPQAHHGALCARLLPEVVEMNLRALQARGPDHEALARYDEAGRLLLGEDYRGPQSLLDWLRDTVETLAIPRLATYGVTPQDFPILVEQAQRASSMKGNPLPLSAAEIREILERAL